MSEGTPEIWQSVGSGKLEPGSAEPHARYVVPLRRREIPYETDETLPKYAGQHSLNEFIVDMPLGRTSTVCSHPLERRAGILDRAHSQSGPAYPSRCRPSGSSLVCWWTAHAWSFPSGVVEVPISKGHRRTVPCSRGRKKRSDARGWRRGAGSSEADGPREPSCV